MPLRSPDDAVLSADGRGAEAAEGPQAEATPSRSARHGDIAPAVIAIYAAHYRSLVGLAALLVRDMAAAEEVVQDSFASMHGAWRRLRGSEKALSYLRQSVVNRSRSLMLQRQAAGVNAAGPAPAAASAETGATTLLERSVVNSALRALPARQREALVLRYYADLSEAQIAAAMGITPGAVQGHLSRAMAVLRHALES